MTYQQQPISERTAAIFHDVLTMKSVSDVAKKYGITPGGVRVNFNHCRSKLCRYFKWQGIPETDKWFDRASMKREKEQWIALLDKYMADHAPNGEVNAAPLRGVEP